jgi:hypothetical protein
LKHFQSENSQRLQTCNTFDLRKIAKIFQILALVAKVTWNPAARKIRQFRDFVMPSINKKFRRARVVIRYPKCKAGRAGRDALLAGLS